MPVNIQFCIVPKKQKVEQLSVRRLQHTYIFLLVIREGAHPMGFHNGNQWRNNAVQFFLYISTKSNFLQHIFSLAQKIIFFYSTKFVLSAVNAVKQFNVRTNQSYQFRVAPVQCSMLFI